MDRRLLDGAGAPGWMTMNDLLRRGMLLALVTACGHVAINLPGPRPYDSDEHRIMFESSLRIFVACFDGRTIAGSGVAVSPRHVITARHVVAGCTGEPASITAVRRDGQTVEVVEDSLAAGIDVARLVAVGGSEPFVVHAGVRLTSPMVGEPICTVANDASATSFLMKCGSIAATAPGKIVAAVHIVPGNSGGPVFDTKAHVIGIWSMGRFDPRMDLFGVATSSRAWSRLLPAR